MKTESATPKKAEQREAVILFVDMMNSSELANVWSLQKYDEFITTFQKDLGEVVEKFINSKDIYKEGKRPPLDVGMRGDEICLMLYRATEKNDKDNVKKLRDDVAAVLQIAIQMKRKWLLCSFNKKRNKEGTPILDIGIGIHQGPVLLGPHYRFDQPKLEKGLNSAPISRSQPITPEGYPINLAKRIESHSRELQFSKILVSHNVINLIESDFRVAFRRVEVGQFKGISQTIPVYEAIGIGHFDDLAFDQDFKKDELEVYEKIVKNNPDLLWLILDLAHYYFDHEEYSKSSEKYQQVIEILPDFAPAQMYLGRCWFRQYRYKEAKYSLERALRLNPLSPRANNFLAVCLRRLAYKYRQDKREGYKELFKTALELHDLAKQRVKKNEPPYIWFLNGLARTIAEADDASEYLSLDKAQDFAKTALNLIKKYRGQTKNKGKEINKEHLVLDTLGYIYLKKWEAKKSSVGVTTKDENLLEGAEGHFNNALNSLEERKDAAGDNPGLMGERNYREKLSEIHFHLAKLYYNWNEFGRTEYIDEAKQQAELAKQTAKEIDDEFLENQYWYGEVQEILNKLSPK